MGIEQFLILLGLYGVPAVLAITLHEAAHGFMALRLGDPTAREQGRLTLNPLKHIDPFGTVVLPGFLISMGAPFLFGYAKPVPVAFHRLNHPKRDMIWVAAVGPLINLLLALLSALIIRSLYAYSGEEMTFSSGVLPYVMQSLIFSIHINITLAVFNMLPIPPLDGGRVMAGLLPSPFEGAFVRMERYGFIIVFILFFLGPALLGKFHPAFSFFNHFLQDLIRHLKDILILPLLEFEVTPP